ncbi:MAG: hypothetical protein R2838_08310 [Caldilineaceae bacterium]
MEATARLHDPFHYGYCEEIVLAGFRRLTGKNSIDLPPAAWNHGRCRSALIHGEEDSFPAQCARAWLRSWPMPSSISFPAEPCADLSPALERG